MKLFLSIAALSLFSLPTLLQGFPWEIFKPRTLKEVISITTKAVRPDDSMFLAQNQLESKVEVVFTGQSRPIGDGRKTLINTWFGMLRSEQKKLAALYELEYLYKEGSEEYWLPTSTPITKYFDKELKPGDRMDIYLISIGAYRSKNEIDCVLLVEEFQKKTNALLPGPQELVVVGSVIKIYTVTGSLRRWAVVVRVDKVVSGEFNGPTFTFTIHSPATANLRVGGTYEIRATRVKTGYEVNEWMIKEQRRTAGDG